MPATSNHDAVAEVPTPAVRGGKGKGAPSAALVGSREGNPCPEAALSSREAPGPWCEARRGAACGLCWPHPPSASGPLLWGRGWFQERKDTGRWVFEAARPPLPPEASGCAGSRGAMQSPRGVWSFVTLIFFFGPFYLFGF